MKHATVIEDAIIKYSVVSALSSLAPLIGKADCLNSTSFIHIILKHITLRNSNRMVA